MALIAVSAEAVPVSLSPCAQGDGNVGMEQGRCGVSLMLPQTQHGAEAAPVPPRSCSPGITRVTVVLPMAAGAMVCLGTEGGAVYFVTLPTLTLLEDKTLFPDEILQR